MRRPPIVAVAVFVLALAVLGLEASWAGFEADESDYVATSRYFGYLVLQRDVSRKEWDGNHWTRTQPPFTRYIVGAWLTGYGYDLETMNQPYVSTASSFEVNRQKGRVPTDEVLHRARQPMVLLGAGAAVLLFVVGSQLGGTLTGLVAAALALSSSFIRYTLVHVWAEAPLAFFLLLSLALALVSVRRILEGRSWIGLTLATGLALGLASATKLTGLVAVVLTAGAGLMMALWLWRVHGDRATATRLATWGTLAAGIALAVFVAVNPYLWRGPATGLLAMLEQRRDEMAFQQTQWPEYAVLTWSERPWLTLSGSIEVGPLAETGLAPLANVPLLLVGVVGLVGVLRQRGPVGPAGMLAAWTIGYVAAILLGLGLKYPRYFMPSTLMFVPLVSLGLVAVFQVARHRLAGARWRPEATREPHVAKPT